MSILLEQVLLSPDASIREVMACVDRNAQGIALILDQDHRLIGTITDGDLRRAILAGTSLELPIHKLLEQNASASRPPPITAPIGTPHAELIRLMTERSIRHIPLLDAQDRVADIALLADLVKELELPLQAVVMAGGLGTRLRPLTAELPKTMLPVGDHPLLERIVRQLQTVGIRRVTVATHYKPEKIIEHFGDGSSFGVELSYLREEQQLGTGGALGLMRQPSEPLLVINGDILTQVDFRAMLDFHKEMRADMTVAVRHYGVQVPYGVVECEASRVLNFREKPEMSFFVNAGIYLLEPAVYRFVPKGDSFSMTDLIQWLLDAERTVVGFPIHEYWLDIGQLDHYEQAQADVKNGTMKG
jgi:dTDP-glucose pyrophosphorylase